MARLRLQDAAPGQAPSLTGAPTLGGEIRLLCPDCATVRAFTRPGCPDGHGPECPELACTRCGSALLYGWSPALRAADRSRLDRRAA